MHGKRRGIDDNHIVGVVYVAYGTYSEKSIIIGKISRSKKLERITRMDNMPGICLIASAGGHFEQLKQLLKLNKKQYKLFYITNKCPATENLEYVSDYIISPHGKNKYETIFGYLRNMIQAVKIVIKRKPDIIISTGAGICIPLCLFGKLLKIKIIFIESFARIERPSKTGEILYKFADVFIIQHEELKRFYPKAIYGGWIY